MPRALKSAEVSALHIGDQVSRYVGMMATEIGTVVRFTRTLILVQWPSESTEIRYVVETGRRVGCHGEQLRVVPEPETLPAIEHVVTDLGHGTANVEPNDEAQVIATVKADRLRAKMMTDRHWLNAVNRLLLERLTWEKANAQEEFDLQLALATEGTEPHRIAMRDLAKREAPYITAASLSAWVVRQRRATQVQHAAVPDYLDFTARG